LEGKYDTTLLTGTMRGLEKSKLNLSPFKQGATCEKQSVLVCTSAGEVGLDVSCDILITEFTYLERLLQRLGRLNRWGECSTAYGYVLKVAKKRAEGEKDSENRRALTATLDYLESLPAHDGWFDVSGYALYQNPAPEAAFSRPPKSLALNEAILAQLANTSSIEHGIPVNEYIRGRDSAYQINLVVRKKQELDALVKMDDDELQNYVAAVPVMTEELFKESANRGFLSVLGELLDERKTLFVSVTGVPKIVDADQLDYWELREGTLYLPDDLACINERGVFEVGGTGTGDVFAKAQEDRRKLVDDAPEYIRYAVDDFGYACLDDAERSQEKKSRKEFLKAIDAGSTRKAKIVFDGGRLLYVKIARKLKAVTMSLTDHAEEAKSVAVQIVSKLGLNSDVTNAVIEAAFHHDDGKAHPLWQVALKGNNNGEPLAKLPYFSKPKLLAGMRHEFVSALDANLGELATWLIGSHHGRCRPSFPEKSYDPLRREESAAFNAKVPFLFEHLVVEHGQWGLAYLEAIVRGVDIQSEEQE
jgi:CRISPR-associated endonuclease/helicase Cas3